MKNTVENAFRCMLAALMLLATSVTSSTIVHGHNGGNLSHQHDQTDSAILQSCIPTVFHNSHDAGTNLSNANVHLHGCLLLLGKVTFLQTPSEPSGSHEKSPCCWETIVAVPSALRVCTLSKGVTIDHSRLASFTCASIEYICQSNQHENLYAGIAPASLLCDRARHERSGVQLI